MSPTQSPSSTQPQRNSAPTNGHTSVTDSRVSPNVSTTESVPTFHGPYRELEPLPDPAYGDRLGPYAYSPLREVVGTRVNPEAYVQFYADLTAAAEEGTKLTCYSPYLTSELTGFDGLYPRARVRQLPASEWPLTGVIPTFSPNGQGRLYFPLQPATYAVEYAHFVSKPGGTPKQPWIEHIKELLPKGSRLILTFYGNHEYLETTWAQGKAFWAQPWLRQFDALVIYNFDAFGNSPRIQSITRERMHQIFATEGTESGFNIIPSLAWANEPSLRRQVRLWVGNPDINTIFVDAYGPAMDKQLWGWRWLEAIERYCAPHTHIRWLIGGLRSGWHIEEFRRMFPKGNFSIIAEREVFVSAMRGSANREIQAEKFAKRIRALEDLRTGVSTATRVPRPDHWPTAAEATLAHAAKKAKRAASAAR